MQGSGHSCSCSIIPDPLYNGLGICNPEESLRGVTETLRERTTVFSVSWVSYIKNETYRDGLDEMETTESAEDITKCFRLVATTRCRYGSSPLAQPALLQAPLV